MKTPAYVGKDTDRFGLEALGFEYRESGFYRYTFTQDDYVVHIYNVVGQRHKMRWLDEEREFTDRNEMLQQLVEWKCPGAVSLLRIHKITSLGI